MRVVKVDIPNGPKWGLEPILMDRLGQVVILAGKNGAGKTRLLQRLIAWCNEPSSQGLPRAQMKIDWNLKNHRKLSSRRNSWWRDDPVVQAYASPWKGNENNVASAKSAVYEDYFDIEFAPSGVGTFVHFVPKGIKLDDADGLTKEEALNRSSQVETGVGVGNLEKSTLARLQVIQNRYWEATHPIATVTQGERENASKNYGALCLLIERFLGCKLGRTLNSQPELFGQPVGQAHLSDGQKVLLQFCIAVHAQADKLSELIVLMDEPENHLHPGVMLDVIEEITKAIPDGQLWIATHSVALLAQFDPDSIWWMEDGGVQHAGSMPEKVLNGLVGNDQRIGKLGDFLGLPAALAAIRFAYQCLLPPSVAGDEVADPQTNQIRQILEAHERSGALRLLDFGAGRGRLASALCETAGASEKFDYLAFDLSAKNRAECLAAIERLYGAATDRYFNNEADLRARVNTGSVDVVVMCNVLHEIDPVEWLGLFNPDAAIRQLLKPDGFLLFVEDMEMRIGEKAHQRGFLVLDTVNLKTLFNIPAEDVRFSVADERGDGRLKAHAIPSLYLGNATKDSLTRAVREVRHFAATEIKHWRGEEASYRNGRKHAFYVQQLANATLALETLGE